jgi:hypothetical protein
MCRFQSPQGCHQRHREKAASRHYQPFNLRHREILITLHAMKGERDHWLNRLCDKADAWLHHLERHCPNCGGELYRRFSVLDKIGLYFPLPHTIYAKHNCDKCHATFRSFRGVTDLFLEAGWLAALFILGEWWLFALAGTIAWLVVSSSFRRNTPSGSNDTIGAGVVLGIVWTLALVFGDEERGAYLMGHLVVFFPTVLFFVFAPVCVVLILDRYTYFRLMPVAAFQKTKAE